jgi:hypothetical protein
LKESKALLFVNKKKYCAGSGKKTFGPAGCGDDDATARKTKSFLVLFFKKELLPLNKINRKMASDSTLLT